MTSDLSKFIVPNWPAPENVQAFSTVRSGGVSAYPYHGATLFEGGLNLALHVGDDVNCVIQNRKRLCQHLPHEPLWLNQVHGSRVVEAGKAKGTPHADASFSVTRQAVCLIQTADCLPVLFCDSKGRTVAAAHAGWRGLAGGVLEATLFRMRQAKAGDVLAWLGPAIGASYFEVGEDVRYAFTSRFAVLDGCFRPQPGLPGKYLADIYALARHILRKQGVEAVSGGDFCTVSETSRFYSYRRDGVTGRMATCIWLA